MSDIFLIPKHLLLMILTKKKEILNLHEKYLVLFQRIGIDNSEDKI